MGGKLGIALQFTENRTKQSMSQSFPCLTSQDYNLCKIKGKAQLKNCVLTIRLCQLTLQLCWGLPGAVEQNSEVGENSCSPTPVLTLLSVIQVLVFRVSEENQPISKFQKREIINDIVMTDSQSFSCEICSHTR